MRCLLLRLKKKKRGRSRIPMEFGLTDFVVVLDA